MPAPIAAAGGAIAPMLAQGAMQMSPQLLQMVQQLLMNQQGGDEARRKLEEQRRRMMALKSQASGI